MQLVKQRNVKLSLGMLCGVLLDLVLVGLSIFSYPQLLGAEGFFTIIGCISLLLLYGVIGIGLPLRAKHAITVALWQGTGVGLIIGGLFIIDLIIENFLDLSNQMSTFSTLGFMLLIFLFFGIAGARGTLKTGQILLGIVAGVWSALLGVLIAVCFGFMVNFLFIQRLEYILASDYARSGMHDPRAFTFFNSLDSAFSHLLEAPIIAVVLGTLGALTIKAFMIQRKHDRISHEHSS